MARCDQKWMWWLAMGAHYTQLNTSDSVRWAHTNIKPNVLCSVAVSNGCHYISNTRQPENSSCTGNTGFLKCAILQRQIASISLYHLVVGSFSHFAHFTVYMNQYIHFSTWCCGRNTTNCYILVLLSERIRFVGCIWFGFPVSAFLAILFYRSHLISGFRGNILYGHK